MAQDYDEVRPDIAEASERTLKDVRKMDAPTTKNVRATSRNRLTRRHRSARRGRKVVGKRGGQVGNYEDWTVPALWTRAKEIGLTGYSKQRKIELILSLRHS